MCSAGTAAPADTMRPVLRRAVSLQALQQVAGVVQGGGLASSDAAAKAPHVFQALLYLRKLCSHPLLVLDPQQPQHVKVCGCSV